MFLESNQELDKKQIKKNIISQTSRKCNKLNILYPTKYGIPNTNDQIPMTNDQIPITKH
ncbi:MAG: hypothetical protein LBT27_05010 [Prevotellaceae bacterium]|nr:hypothetical protein [Prevotellaceae bacterium]